MRRGRAPKDKTKAKGRTYVDSSDGHACTAQLMTAKQSRPETRLVAPTESVHGSPHSHSHRGHARCVPVRIHTTHA
eukprot:365296-Chlamydomonas_euryale.AAC.39